MKPKHLHRPGPVAAAVVVAAALVLATTPVAAAAPAGAIRIGSRTFPTIQAALNASRDGDTILVPMGTFPGGITIKTSITLKGAGAGRTVLRGGEHVVAVGTQNAQPGTEPEVTIAGLTISGGIATSYFNDRTDARGGGILVVADTNGGGGTLTLIDSAVRSNRTAPAAQFVRGPIDLTVDPDLNDAPVCPRHRYCNRAQSWGASIFTGGDLTLIRTTVMDNEAAGGLSSDADGGGIFINSGGSLRALESHIDRNRAEVFKPFGRFAEGGGVFTESDTTLDLSHTTVNRNTASLTAGFPVSYDDYDVSFPVSTDTLANGGGIHVGEGTAIRLRNSHVDRNVARYNNPHGSGAVINSGLQSNGASRFVMTDSSVDGNLATATVLSTRDWGAQGSAVQWDTAATISRSSVSRNRTEVTAIDGIAAGGGAVAALNIADEFAPATTTISDSVIADNRVEVTSRQGAATIAGVGMITDTDMRLIRTKITGNVGVARTTRGESSSLLYGGGIDDGAQELFPGYVGDSPESSLTLTDSIVRGNSLSTTYRDATVSGGGIHAVGGATLVRSVVRGNSPDDCDGCSANSVAESRTTRPRIAAEDRHR